MVETKEIRIRFPAWGLFCVRCARKGYEVISGRVSDDRGHIILVSGVPFDVATQAADGSPEYSSSLR